MQVGFLGLKRPLSAYRARTSEKFENLVVREVSAFSLVRTIYVMLTVFPPKGRRDDVGG